MCLVFTGVFTGIFTRGTFFSSCQRTFSVVRLAGVEPARSSRSTRLSTVRVYLFHHRRTGRARAPLPLPRDRCAVHPGPEPRHRFERWACPLRGGCSATELPGHAIPAACTRPGKTPVGRACTRLPSAGHPGIEPGNLQDQSLAGLPMSPSDHQAAVSSCPSWLQEHHGPG